jgi:DNA-binding NarL/FixJ family response regulator
MYFETNQFSEREKDVIKLLLQGKGNKQIALELGISNRTVEFHLSNIYAKLGINTRSEAILKFTESRLRESTGGHPVESTV